MSLLRYRLYKNGSRYKVRNAGYEGKGSFVCNIESERPVYGPNYFHADQVERCMGLLGIDTVSEYVDIINNPIGYDVPAYPLLYTKTGTITLDNQSYYTYSTENEDEGILYLIPTTFPFYESRRVVNCQNNLSNSEMPFLFINELLDPTQIYNKTTARGRKLNLIDFSNNNEFHSGVSSFYADRVESCMSNLGINSVGEYIQMINNPGESDGYLQPILYERNGRISALGMSGWYYSYVTDSDPSITLLVSELFEFTDAKKLVNCQNNIQNSQLPYFVLGTDRAAIYDPIDNHGKVLNIIDFTT